MAAARTDRPKKRPTKKPAPAKVEVVVLAKAWAKALPDAPLLARRAARAALAAIPAAKPRGIVAIALADDATLRELNHQFRGANKPTNVLSFPAAPPDLPGASQLGDIALALQTLQREARDQGKTLRQHLMHLVVHGTLHLLGHDHERPAQARRMENLEREVLAGLGIGDPYSLPAPAMSQPKRKLPL
jgi:probable rRNA maturation factor